MFGRIRDLSAQTICNRSQYRTKTV